MEEALLLKNLETALEEAKVIPLWGSPPPFPLDAFAKELSQVIEQEEVKIEIESTDWMGADQLLEGMGQDPSVLPFTLSPLPGEFFWVLAKSGNNKLSTLLTSDKKGFTDPALQEGFAKFFYLNVLDVFNQLNPFGNLTATLASDCPLPEEAALCYNICVSVGEKTFNARLICPKETRLSFASFFQMHTPPLLSDPEHASLPVPLHIEVGSTQLRADEWSKAKVGDFLLLDRCTYDLDAKRGRGTLVLGTTPLFDVRLKDGEVKLLEPAMIQEEHTMHEDNPDENEHLSKMEEDTEAPLWSGEDGEKSQIEPSQVPIHLTVEVGRLQMPLDKVTQLKPGNVLELGHSPEANVHLTIGGKRVATGELVRLGDALGVKILKIGG
jgi:flagellar motor switch protein FliN